MKRKSRKVKNMTNKTKDKIKHNLNIWTKESPNIKCRNDIAMERYNVKGSRVVELLSFSTTSVVPSSETFDKFKAKYDGNVFTNDEYDKLINQMLDDEMQHLFPICLTFECGPEEARKMVGQGAWRTFCSQDIIQNATYLHVKDCMGEDASMEDVVARIKEMAKYDINIIKACFDVGQEKNDASFRTVEYIKRVSKWAEEDPDEIVDFASARKMVSTRVQKIIDTAIMAEQLERDFNPQWSWKRMKRAHDEYQVAMESFKLDIESDHVFKVAEKAQNIISTLKFNEKHNVEIKALSCVKDFVDEALDMNHCIKGLITQCHKGKFLGFSIKVDGKRSTLGYNVSREMDANGMPLGNGKYSQREHVFNSNASIASDFYHHQIAGMITSQLNSYSEPSKN